MDWGGGSRALKAKMYLKDLKKSMYLHMQG